MFLCQAFYDTVFPESDPQIVSGLIRMYSTLEVNITYPTLLASSVS